MDEPEKLYTCGKCEADNAIINKNPIISCVKCGHKIFYKKRTKIPQEFLAR